MCQNKIVNVYDKKKCILMILPGNTIGRFPGWIAQIYYMHPKILRMHVYGKNVFYPILLY
jgi:hypothetical protein